MKQNLKAKILVVDDDRLVLATLAHGLAQAGHEVIDADNGDDAILLAHEHRPDLALLDIRMQGMSGFDVAAYLREHCHVPFMFLSAFSDAQTVAQVKALGAVAYLVKPLDIGQIRPVVATALANPQQARSDAAAVVPAAATSISATDASETLIATGIFMQRFSLPRAAALERLQRLAATERRSLDEQARRVLEAVEMLALPDGG